MLQELSRSLKHRLGLPLPGTEAQFRMAHVERQLNLLRYKTPENARLSGVMILLFESEGRIKVPLILRPVDSGIHSGQVSLPGGRQEPEDADLRITALRETQEEIGISASDVDVIGKLTHLYIPTSNFLVHPYIGILEKDAHFNAEEKEVVRIISMDLESLMDERTVKEKMMKLSTGQSINTPCFSIEGEMVWGATAMILSELKSLLYEIGW